MGRKKSSRRRQGRAVAILAYRYARRNRMWGEQTKYLAGLMQTAADLRVKAYVCGPQDIDLNRGRVLAWGYQPGRGWYSYRAALPALVYNRFFLRKEPAAGRHLARYRALAGTRRLKFLSPQLPDKNRVHKILQRAKDLKPHLPPTILYNQPGQVAARLARWRKIVLKPIRGQKGLGLWFLRPGGGKSIVALSGTGQRQRINRSQLASWCQRRLAAGNYQIQPWLALHDEGGRPRDVRVLVQRDGYGLVAVTGLGVRLGRKGSLVANLHRGGQAAAADEAISKVVPPEEPLLQAVAKANPVAATVGPGAYAGASEAAARAAKGGVPESLALVAWRVFDVLNQRLGSFAELAIDLGVDGDGRIWFIEANSRPGRIIFRRMGDHLTRRRAVAQPLLYARYLMGEEAGAAL